MPEVDKDKRRGQIDATHNAIANGWPAIHAELQHRIDLRQRELVETLSPKTAGAIKELQSLQRLPQDLRDEAERLNSVIELPEPVELTGTLGEY